jgi:single-stranded DNA-specific DHH superfamily exonuclease
MNAVEFLKNLKPSDSVVIIFNNDADGICSCTLISLFLDNYIKIEKKPFIIPQPMPMDRNLIQRIQTTLPTKLIFLDLAADQQQNMLNRMSGISDILIIDHHQVTKNMNSRTITHCNPRFRNSKIYQSTSYLTYKLCSELTDMSDYLWVAAIGIVADYNLDDSADLVEAIKKKYKIADLKDSLISKISEMISAARATRALSNEEIVNIIENTKNPDAFPEANDKLIDSYKKIETEIMAIMVDTEKSSEKIGKIIFYNMKSKFNLRPEISTRLSEKYPDKLIIVYETVGNKVKLSARNQKNIDVGKILEKAAGKMDASAGGHDKAAGATLGVKDWEEFKENLTSLLV